MCHPELGTPRRCHGDDPGPWSGWWPELNHSDPPRRGSPLLYVSVILDKKGSPLLHVSVILEPGSHRKVMRIRCAPARPPAPYPVPHTSYPVVPASVLLPPFHYFKDKDSCDHMLSSSCPAPADSRPRA